MKLIYSLNLPSKNAFFIHVGSIFVFLLFLISCSRQEEDKNNNRVYFGYRLGETTSSITDSLLSAHAFITNHPLTLTYTSTEIGELEVKGFPFYLYVPNAKYTGHLHLIEFHDVLARQMIFIKPGKYEKMDINPLITELRTKYGKPSAKRPRNQYYEINRRYAKYYWRFGDKAIYLGDCRGFYVLCYESISAITELNRSLEKAKGQLRDLEREELQEKAEKNPL